MALVDGIFLLPLVLPPTVVGFFLLLAFRAQRPARKTISRIWRDGRFFLAGHRDRRSRGGVPADVLDGSRGTRTSGPHLLQAARTLGASEWRVFREVALPLAWPGVLAGTILSFARALGEFGATLMLAGNIPGRTETIPIAIYFAVEANDMSARPCWCLIDVGISLALLAGLYYWTHAQAPERARWARR